MTLGLLIAVAASLWATHQICVGGPTYTKIIQGKDLVADILPPPAYIIESYLEATLALNGAKPIAESVITRSSLTPARCASSAARSGMMPLRPPA
ncbi:MAG: hypothetical protein GEU95_13550 [Rhizobiales bacterium]|nr:hypothetical protein [Hyphomicrobiales bacterium]